MHVPRRAWLIYLLLLIVAVPWYWRLLPGSTSLVAGVPAWVASAIAGSALISAYTMWLLRRPWAGERPDEAA